jgi:competence protein ComEA
VNPTKNISPISWFRSTCLVIFVASIAGTLALSFSPTNSTTYAQTQTAPATPQYPELPAGPGRDNLIRVCSKCHSPLNVVANGQSHAGWEDTISKMVGFGADGTDDDYNAILEYLAKNFPPPNAAKVNVNTATAQQLSTGLQLTPAQADAIVQYRTANGAFKTIDDLKKVPGLDAAKLDALAARLAF